MVEIVFYCPYIPVITTGIIRVEKTYEEEEYLLVVKCPIHQVEEVLDQAFPQLEDGDPVPSYDHLINLIIK